MAIETVPLSEIVRKPELQSRAALSMDRIAEIAADIEDGDNIPPVTLYRLSDSRLYLTRGWHRIAAAESLGLKEFQANIKDGSWFDALVDSAISEDNQIGPLSRTNEDKRRQVTMYLSVPGNADKSDHLIHNLLHVSASVVASVRRELRLETDVRTDAKGRKVKIGKIGKRAQIAEQKKQDILANSEASIAVEAQKPANEHAVLTGKAVTPAVLETAVEVITEKRATGLVDVGVAQLPVNAIVQTDHGPVNADMAALLVAHKEKVDTHIHNGAFALQAVYGKVQLSGKGRMLLEFGPEFEEKLIEFMKYKDQYPGHVVKVCIYPDDNAVRPVKRPSQPKAKPGVKPYWERIADGETVEEDD